MDGRIIKKGILIIKRKERMEVQHCPYEHPDDYKVCGDTCPLFGEPEVETEQIEIGREDTICDKKTQDEYGNDVELIKITKNDQQYVRKITCFDMYKKTDPICKSCAYSLKTRKATLDLCRKKLQFDNFIDERE